MAYDEGLAQRIRASLPTVGRRGSRIPKLVGLGVGSALQLRHFLLLFQPLGVVGE